MLVVVGESLVDLIHRDTGEVVAAPGGSCLNVAVAASRLGTRTLLVTEIGDDDHGRLLLDHLRDSDVEVVAAEPPSGRTSTATAVLDESGAASYTFDLSWGLAPQDLPRCDALHVGSLGAVLQPGAEQVLDLARQAVDRDILVTYDPNARPALMPDADEAWARAVECAALAQVVKMSDEDCAALRPDSPVDAVASSLLSEHTRLVVVTRGGRGATAYADQLRIDLAAPEAMVVDTVGAGDSLMAALLVQILERDLHLDDGWFDDEETISLVLQRALTAAAVTVSRSGAEPPRRDDLPSDWV